jgi:nitrogen PTS system EIIA component
MDKILTTRELAEYVKLNEKTIIKMAQEGKLPGVKISNKWRFQLSAVDHYLQKSIVQSSDDELNVLIETADTVQPLSRLIDPAMIRLDSPAADKHAVLSGLAEVAEYAGLVQSRADLLDQLVKREKMLSTGIGQGVALPHPRNPHVGFISRPCVAFFRTATPIDFEATDGKPCDLFFLICAPNAYVHVRLLAKVAKFLHHPGSAASLRQAGSSDDVLRVFLTYERDEITLKPEATE